jgi:hypothetical protein
MIMRTNWRIGGMLKVTRFDQRRSFHIPGFLESLKSDFYADALAVY